MGGINYEAVREGSDTSFPTRGECDRLRRYKGRKRVLVAVVVGLIVGLVIVFVVVAELRGKRLLGSAD
jgi:hypothetical protein